MALPSRQIVAHPLRRRHMDLLASRDRRTGLPGCMYQMRPLRTGCIAASAPSISAEAVAAAAAGVLFAGGAVSLDHAATAHRETSAAVAVFCLLNLSAMLAPRLSDWYGAQREGSVDRHRLSISETGRALARITAPNTSRRTSPRNATCCRGCAFGRVRLVLGPDRSSRARESGT